MAYDEGLAERIRGVLEERTDTVEKRMFGGLCFMVAGHMCCGVVDDSLMARVGPDAYDDCLTQPHARQMDFTGRPMRGLVFVDAQGISEDRDLEAWVNRCLDFVYSLPAKS